MLLDANILKDATQTSFRKEILEKVHHLLEMLEYLCRHPYLKSRIALKGGTALNLFIFDVPRLSVDIDLNYVGGVDRTTMLLERPKIEQAIQGVSTRLGLIVKRIPSEHAGGKWRMTYAGNERRGSLEIDLNFMHRVPLWEIKIVNSYNVGSQSATDIPVLDFHDLAAGKLSALFSRNASRDLFDSQKMLAFDGLDWDRLRLGFVVYGAMARRDWREISLMDIVADPNEVDRMLVPMLRGEAVPRREKISLWTKSLVVECRDKLAKLLPLRNNEIAFLKALNETGKIEAELLTDDLILQRKIETHPAILWKALNVKAHFRSD